MHFEWSCSQCQPTLSTSPTYQVEFASRGSVQVQLATFDNHGAEDTSLLPLEVTDRAPTVQVRVIPSNSDGTNTVTKAIAVSASASDEDGDQVTYRAVVDAPPTSDPNQMQFIASKDTVLWTLVPDVPGHWTVDVTASDGFGGSTTETQAIEVIPDQPPCLAITVPDANTDGHYLILRDDGPRRFGVASVTDDLDPFPGGQTRFNWWLGPSGALPAPVAGHDFSDFTVDPAGYLPGDVLELRVEIADRSARTFPCAADQPRCSIGGNECFQRETWELEVR